MRTERPAEVDRLVRVHRPGELVRRRLGGDRRRKDRDLVTGHAGGREREGQPVGGVGVAGEQVPAVVRPGERHPAGQQAVEAEAQREAVLDDDAARQVRDRHRDVEPAAHDAPDERGADVVLDGGHREPLRLERRDPARGRRHDQLGGRLAARHVDDERGRQDVAREVLTHVGRVGGGRGVRERPAVAFGGGRVGACGVGAVGAGVVIVPTRGAQAEEGEATRRAA